MKFNTTQDLLKDPVFIAEVSKRVEELRTKRINRPMPPKGHYYKRDWYDRMREQGSVNSAFFLKHIESIWAKKSTLSSEVRKVILEVCTMAAYTTFQHYEKEAEEQSVDVKEV